MVVRALANLKEKKGLHSAKRMMEYLNNKKGSVSVLVGANIHRGFFVNEKCWKQHGSIFWSTAYHEFILFFGIQGGPLFYLSTFLKVDIDIITTPRRSHLTQLPIVFYAEQSGGELR